MYIYELFFILGPLNNMKESMIQFSKPRKLVNKTNPVSMNKQLFLKLETNHNLM